MISLPRPWTAHTQIEWENRAANPKLPYWLRLVCYAYARHEANGHANFDVGRLEWLLGKPPVAGRPFERASKYAVRDGIGTAVKYGWLEAGSCAGCLVVPAHAIDGPLGDRNKACRVHDRKAQARRSKLRVVS